MGSSATATASADYASNLHYRARSSRCPFEPKSSAIGEWAMTYVDLFPTYANYVNDVNLQDDSTTSQTIDTYVIRVMIDLFCSRVLNWA